MHIPPNSTQPNDQGAQTLHQGEVEDDDEELHAAQNGDNNEEDEDDTVPQLSISPIKASYNPPRHMRHFIDDQLTELYHSMSLPIDQGIALGMQFYDKNECIIAIRFYHIKQSLDYIVKQSDQERYVTKCKIQIVVSNCVPRGGKK